MNLFPIDLELNVDSKSFWIGKDNSIPVNLTRIGNKFTYLPKEKIADHTEIGFPYRETNWNI